ncbi:MAG: hypothetical protein ACLS8R_08845 [Anaeromassilibacillus sp.]
MHGVLLVDRNFSGIEQICKNVIWGNRDICISSIPTAIVITRASSRFNSTFMKIIGRLRNMKTAPTQRRLKASSAW